MTVVVTGASGHIGINLVRALVAEKRSVRAMAHHNHQVLEGLGVEIVQSDITDVASLSRAFEGAEVVYHLAGVISLLKNEWPLVERINVQGTRNVIEACRRSNVKRLVHFSSIHAINPEPLDRPVDENHPLIAGRGYPPYDLSKAEAAAIMVVPEATSLRPLIEEIASQHTPESLLEGLRAEPGRVLLRTAQFDLPSARYSLVTVRPLLTFRSLGAYCEIR